MQPGVVYMGHLHRAGAPKDVANLSVIDYYSRDELLRMVTIFGNRLWSPDEGKVVRGRPGTLLQIGDGILWNRLVLDNATPDAELVCPHCHYAGHLPTDSLGFAIMPDLTDQH